MDCGDEPNGDLDSMDLYSRVKLRGLSNKARIVRKDIFPATNEKLVSAGLRKFKANFGKRKFSLDLATDVENQARQNPVAVETASRLRSLVAVTVVEIDEWRNYKKDLSIQRANANGFDDSNHMLDEGTAIEMLGQLREGRTKNVCNQFDVGDLVWGKITPHPWWPGQIYNEALASSSVLSTKKEGCILVTFFGDYTYGWLDPRYLIPFDIHYAGKYRQTNDRVFLEAVKEAIREFKRRAALGLVCYCQNPSNFRPIKVGRLFEVDFNGFIAGGIYCAKQIEKARDDFQPDETLVFLKQIALSPRNIAPQNLFLVKNMVKVLFYRRASLQNFDETYLPAIEVQQRSCQDPRSSLVDKAELVGLLEAKTRENQVLKQATKANDLHNRDDILGKKLSLNFSWGSFSHKGSGGHEMQIPSERSNFVVSEEAQYKPLQEQIRSDGAINAGKKGNILGLPEFSSMKKPVMQKNVKDLARISGNPKLFELHGDKRKGIETSSSMKLEREPIIETNSIRSNVELEPRMLVIKFPPEAMLPSVSELKAKFARFGPLHESSVGVSWKSLRCQIVFQHRTDAVAAYHHATQNRTLFSSQVSYELQMARVADSELPRSSQCSTKPVEEGRVEIQPEPSLSRAEFFHGLKPTFQQLLLPEKIKREPWLEELANDGPSCPSVLATPVVASHRYDSEIPQNMTPMASPWTSLCYTTEQFGFSQNVDDINQNHCQVGAMKNNDHHTSTGANDAEKKDKLINLLYSCSHILGEIKHLI